MQIRWDQSLVEPRWLVIGLTVYLLVAAVYYRRLFPIVARSYWWVLAGSKLLAAAAVLLAVLNPYAVTQAPDRERQRLAVLIDATGSMATRDCGERSRLDVARQDLLAPAAPFRRVLERFPRNDLQLFAGNSLWRVPGSDFGPLPGLTDVDGALRQVLAAQTPGAQLGAVLLATDGLDNQGLGLLDAAGPYRQAGIPIHVVGIGDRREHPDLALQWLTVPAEALKGRPVTLTALLRRNVGGRASYDLEFSENGRFLRRQSVTFEDDERERQVNFEHTAFVSGFKTYRVHAVPLPDERNVLNNVDLAGLPVKDPEHFRVLFFSANLDWNYRFLQQLANSQSRLELDAAIRLGERTWWRKGLDLEQQAEPGLPPAGVLNRYDCVILDLGASYLLRPADLEALTGFVAARGGGLICTGRASPPLPPPLAQLLPLRGEPDAPEILPAPSRLELRPGSLFQTPGGRSERLAARLSAPDGSAVARLAPERLKAGALAAALIQGPGYVAVAVQNYGAGKTCYLNLPDTWKWVLADEGGESDFAEFWGRLVTWASSSSRQRFTVRPTGAKLRLGEEVEFTLDVLDPQYRGDNQARPAAVAVGADGDSPLSFLADPRVDGRYVAKLVPRQPGELRLRFQAERNDGERLEEGADYVVVADSPESQPAPLAEAQLQALARLTGGEYWHYRDLGKMRDLPLSIRAARVPEHRHGLDAWLLLLAVLLAVLPDWYLRRRLGLR